jgi:hypothetical protein
MGDKTRGIYGKFIVERTDGKSAPGKKHDGCDYFVLDLHHDPFALPAAIAYAEACRAEYPLLADDLDRLVVAHRKPVIRCKHSFHTSGQKVEGGIDHSIERCVKCGEQKLVS